MPRWLKVTLNILLNVLQTGKDLALFNRKGGDTFSGNTSTVSPDKR